MAPTGISGRHSYGYPNKGIPGEVKPQRPKHMEAYNKLNWMRMVMLILCQRTQPIHALAPKSAIRPGVLHAQSTLPTDTYESMA